MCSMLVASGSTEHRGRHGSLCPQNPHANPSARGALARTWAFKNDGWREGWTGDRLMMEGWKYGWTEDEFMMSEQKDELVDGCMDEWVEGRLDG